MSSSKHVCSNHRPTESIAGVILILSIVARMIKARKEYRRIRDMFRRSLATLARGYLARKLYAKDLEEAKERARRLEEIKRREADDAERARYK